MTVRSDQPPTSISGEPRPRYRDDLEAQIDEFLEGIGDLFRFHYRGLIILALLGTLFYLWVWPARGAWVQPLVIVLFALLQIAFAIVFVIIQFAAIFWFLGRGRTYWVKPGETGVTFEDYRGNPEVLESARRVVTLLRGVREFKEMGGEAVRGLLLVGPPGTGKCVAADTLVFTSAGMVPIEQFAPLAPQPESEVALDLTVAGVGGRDRVIGFYNGGVRPTRRLTTAAGFTLEGTLEHPIMVMGSDGVPTWRRLDQVAEGDYVAIGYGHHLFGAHLMRVGRFTMTPELGYVLGLLVGDGAYGAENSRVLLTNLEPSIREAWSSYLNSIGVPVRYLNEGRTLYTQDADFRRFLDALGLARAGSAEKEIPRGILCAPMPIVRAFLQGLFDADGTAGKRDGYVLLNTISERLARQVQVVLLNFGIVARRRAKDGVFQGVPYRSWEISLTGRHARAFYQRIGFRLERKQSRQGSLPTYEFDFTDVIPHQTAALRAVMTAQPRARAIHKRLGPVVRGKRSLTGAFLREFVMSVNGEEDKTARGHLGTLAGQQIFWDPIRSLEDGQAQVYDLMVETTHSFLSNGIVSHNSYLAQAISSEANVPFGYASAPSFQNMFFGVSNLRIMMLYRKARKLARKYGACILFIDEIDAIGGSRGGRMGGGMPGFLGGLFGMGGSGLLNELLLQLDPPPQELTLVGRLLRSLGLRRRRAELPPVLTIAATNLPDALDPALLRPGRFDRKIVVEAPDADGRREIIEYYLAKVSHDPNLPIDYMVADTIGYTPVAIRYVINEAVIHAHFEGRKYITYDDFTAARETHELGLRQPIKSMSYEERRRLAYHEAGHAIAQHLLRSGHRVVKVSIIRHGEALGFSATKPTEERHTRTRDEILSDIQISLASRAAEELFLGIKMSGVTNDLAQATHLANLAVSMWGMDGSLYSALAYNQTVPDLFRKRRIERILDHQLQNAKRLLEANREATIAIAEALLVHDELNEQQIKEILAPFELVVPPPLPEPVESPEEREVMERMLAQASGYDSPPPAMPGGEADGSAGGGPGPLG